MTSLALMRYNNEEERMILDTCTLLDNHTRAAPRKSTVTVQKRQVTHIRADVLHSLPCESIGGYSEDQLQTDHSANIQEGSEQACFRFNQPPPLRNTQTLTTIPDKSLAVNI